MTPVAVIFIVAASILAVLLSISMRKARDLDRDLAQLQKRSESFRGYSDIGVLCREIQDLGHEFTEEVLAKISKVLGPFRVKVTIRDRTIFDTGVYPPGMDVNLQSGVDLRSTHIFVENIDEFGPEMTSLYPIAIAINNWAERTHLSITDELTGLYNRRGWRQKVDGEMTRAERYSHPLSVVMIDLDNFKEINDTYGHPAGDSVLIEASNLFLRLIRKQIDVVARWGGDEMIFLLPEADSESALGMAEKIKEAISTHSFRVDGTHVGMSASIGVATFPDTATNYEDLKRRADEALYLSKERGKNQITSAPVI